MKGFACYCCLLLLLDSIASFSLAAPGRGAPLTGRSKSPEAAVPPAAAPLSAAQLRWKGAEPEELVFMRRVYDRQLQKTSQGRKPTGDLPASRLTAIEGELLAQPQVALATRSLLKAARLEIQRNHLDAPGHKQVQGVGVMSAYRPPSYQFTHWQDNFPRYYENTDHQRRILPGGEFGEAAVEFMARYVQKRFASPGFSLHNRGLAIDFKTRENGALLTTSTSKINIEAWRRSWFYAWLGRNAGKYRFYLNPHIDEPWHWEYGV